VLEKDGGIKFGDVTAMESNQPLQLLLAIPPIFPAWKICDFAPLLFDEGLMAFQKLGILLVGEKIFHAQNVQIGNKVGSVLVDRPLLLPSSQSRSLQPHFGYALLDFCYGFGEGFTEPQSRMLMLQLTYNYGAR
jgi:hypothetical protein